MAHKTFLRLHHSLYSLQWKKYGKFQNLGAVEFCPFLVKIYDIFTPSLLPIQSSARKVRKSPKYWGSWVLSIFRRHLRHFYAFTTPYIVFGEKSTEKSLILGQLSFIHFKVACTTSLRLHHFLYSLYRKKYGKVQNFGAVDFCPFLVCIYDIFMPLLLPI